MTTIPYPTNATPQILRLFQNHITLVNMFTIFALLEGEIPHMLNRLKDEDPEKEQSISNFLTMIRYHESERYKYSHIIAEIYLCRIVDQFHSYVVDMLRVYFREHPEQLSPKVKRGKPREVAGRGAKAPNNADYYAMIQADKQLQDGFSKVVEFLETAVGLDVKTRADIIKEADMAISIRNIITHNRGRMNERFLNRISDEDGSTDLPLIFDQNQANYYVGRILDGAVLIDSAFIKKYGMEIFSTFEPFSTLAEGVVLGNTTITSVQLDKRPEDQGK